MPGRKAQPVADRIWSAIRITDGGCWEWLKARDANGYGFMWVGSRTDGSRRLSRVHLVAYRTFEGEIPEGFELDHLCRNTRCCNPAHLEPVTPRENMLRSTAPCAANARKTHCKRGHEFTPENTYVNRRKRYCIACRKELAA